MVVDGSFTSGKTCPDFSFAAADIILAGFKAGTCNKGALKSLTDVVVPVPVDPLLLKAALVVFVGTCLQLVLVKDVKECSEPGPLLSNSCFCCQHQASQGGIYFCEANPCTVLSASLPTRQSSNLLGCRVDLRPLKRL